MQDLDSPKVNLNSHVLPSVDLLQALEEQLIQQQHQQLQHYQPSSPNPTDIKPSNENVLESIYKRLCLLYEDIERRKEAIRIEAEVRSELGKPLTHMATSIITILQEEACSIADRTVDLVNSEDVVRLGRLVLIKVAQLILTCKSDLFFMGELCQKVQSLVQEGQLNKIPQLIAISRMPTKKISMVYMRLQGWRHHPQILAQKCQQLINYLTTINLKDYNNYHAVYRRMLSEMVMTAMVLIQNGSKVTEKAKKQLLEIVVAVGFQDNEFTTNLFLLFKDMLRRPSLYEAYELDLLRQLIIIWEVQEPNQKISSLIQIVFNMASIDSLKKTLQTQTRIANIINFLINSNIEKVVIENLNVIPYFQQIDESVRGSLYNKCFPLAMKALEKKQHNIDLSNLLVEWRVKMSECNQNNSFDADIGKFIEFFRGIIPCLSEHTILLIYNCKNVRMRRHLMMQFARYFKNRKNLREETMNRFLLSQTFEKLNTNTEQHDQFLLSVLQLMSMMHSPLNGQEDICAFEFPEVTVRQTLRLIYNTKVAPRFYQDLCRKDKFYGQNAIRLLCEVCKVQSLLEDASASKRVNHLQQYLYIFIKRNTDLSADLLDQLSVTYLGHSNCSTTQIYLAAILYDAICNMDEEDEEDKRMFEKHVVVFEQQQSLNDSIPYFTYSSQSFRSILLLMQLKCSTVKTTNLLRRVLIGWLRLCSMREMAMFYDSCKYEMTSEFIQEKIVKLQSLKLLMGNETADRGLTRLMNSTEVRMIIFLETFLEAVRKYTDDSHGPRRGDHIVKSGFSDRVSVTYDMPIFQQLRDLCNFQLKFVFFRRSHKSKSSSRLKRPQSVVYQRLNSTIGSPVNTGAPDYLSNHRFTLRLQQTMYCIYINNTNIYTILKGKTENSDSGLSVISSYTEPQTLFRNQITFKFDMLSLRVAVELNKVHICYLPCSLSKKCRNISVDYEWNEEAALGAVKFKQSQQRYFQFPFEDVLQIRDQFTLSFDHLKSCHEVWKMSKYLDLRYLMALIYQMVNSEFSLAIKNFKQGFDLFYQIVLKRFSTLSDDEDVDIILEFLERLTITLARKFMDINLQVMQAHLIDLVERQEPGSLLSKFIHKILLNYEIWSYCPYATQIAALKLFQKVLAGSWQKQKKENKALFDKFYTQLQFISFDFLEEKPGVYEPEEAMQFKLLSFQISSSLVDFTNIEDACSKFSEFIVKIMKDRLMNRPDNRKILLQVVETMMNKIVNGAYEMNQKGFPVIRNKKPLIELCKLSAMSWVYRLLPTSTKLTYFRMLYQMLADMGDLETSRAIRRILNSLRSEELVTIDEEVHNVLITENTKISKQYTNRHLAIELISHLCQNYRHYSNQDQEVVLTIMMLYFRVSGFHGPAQLASEVISLGPLFTRASFVSLIVQFTIPFVKPKKGQPVIPKRNKIVEQIFAYCFHISKSQYLAFTTLLLKKASGELQVLEHFLTEAIGRLPYTPVTLHNITLQFCFCCLVILHCNLSQEKYAFAELIYTYVKSLMEQPNVMIFSVFPLFGWPAGISANSVNLKDGFQIRGGIFYKVLINLLHCAQILQNPHIIRQIVELLIIKVEKVEEFKSIKKKKSQKQQAVASLLSKKQYSDLNEIEELTRLMSVKYEEKHKDLAVGQCGYRQELQRGEISFFCLEYCLLKMAVMYMDNKIAVSVRTQCQKAMQQIIKQYQQIKFDKEQNHTEILTYQDFISKISEVSQSRGLIPQSPLTNTRNYEFSAFTGQDGSDGDRTRGVVSQLPDMFSTPIKRFTSTRLPQSERQRQSPFLKVPSIQPKTFQSPDSLTKRKVSISMKLMDLSPDELIDKIRKQSRKEARKLLLMQYLYTYLTQRMIDEFRGAEQQEREEDHIAGNRILPLSLLQTKEPVNPKIQTYWKNFLEIQQRQDGILYERYRKKDPILRVLPVYVANGTYPITQLTTDYNYEIQRQQKISLTRRQTYLSYAFLKNIGSVILQTGGAIDKPLTGNEKLTQAQSPTVNLSNTNTTSAVEPFFGSFLSDEMPNSPDKKQSYDCQLITIKGSYFCSLKIDRHQWVIQIESDGSGRQDIGQRIFGSPHTNIITKKKSVTIRICDITEVIMKKFNQIVNNSLQIYTKYGRSFFVVLYTYKFARAVLKTIKMSRMLPVENLIEQWEKTFKKRRYIERWQAGQISNFDYLMLINKYSGRSFNDPNQYYIFPWVLCDYQSEQLNLKDHRIYRNLEKHIGALNEDKLNKFKEMEESHPPEQKYLYGAFFSASLFVFFYLVRLQPFSTMAHELQNHKFDAADRLFLSIDNTWQSLMNPSNTSDLKELIPQFYYLPTFLENMNSLVFGKTQTGQEVSSVGLPPWAHSSNDFITKMRCAFESDFVSAKLHAWIDLIYGVNQNNRAVQSNFHPRYYAQNFNFTDMGNQQLTAVLTQITYFGQFPSKLFTKGHPSKIMSSKFFIQLDPNPNKFIAKKDTFEHRKSLESLYTCHNRRIVIVTSEARQTKYFIINAITQPFKIIEIDRKQVSTEAFSQHISLEEGRAQSIYLNVDMRNKLLLKSFKLDRDYKRVIVNQRFFAHCGRKGVHVFDMEGRLYYSWTEDPVLDISLTPFGLVFIIKNSKANIFRVFKINFLKKETSKVYNEEVPYRILDASIVAVQDLTKETYAICLNRKHMFYLSRSNL